MRDFESYYAAGVTWAQHRDPYSTDIWASEQHVPGVDAARTELLPFVGPPAFLPIWAIFARFPYPIAALVWGGLLAALACMFVFVILRRTDTWSAGTAIAAAAVLIGFGPFTSDLALGQAALLSFVACVGATVMLARSRITAIIWTVFSAIQPNISVILLSQAGRRRALIYFGIAFACLVALCLACAGWSGTLAYFAGLRAHAKAEEFALIQITPSAIIYGFGAVSSAARITGIAIAIGTLGLWLAVMRAAYEQPLWKLAISCALLPFVAPFFHEHDFLVLLLPAVLCAILARGRMWTIAACGTALAGVDWLGLAQRPDGVLQSVLLLAALLCGLHALSERSARTLILPAFVLLAVFGAGLLAGHHPAPIWPDAMRGGPARTGSTAVIWHDELARTGEFASNPVWAFLRSLTLSGAGLLAWATIVTAARRDQLEIS